MGDLHDSALCPRFHYAVELIGRRWTGAILFLLLRGPTRFTDLREAIPGITDPMLSARLHELESEGIVERSVLPESPVRVQYALTAKGQALSEVMSTIGDWSRRWVATPKTDAKPAAKDAAAKPARRDSPRRAVTAAPARRLRVSRAR
jgi:DNA-binding HxlR family transcriptional regulator